MSVCSKLEGRHAKRHESQAKALPDKGKCWLETQLVFLLRAGNHLWIKQIIIHIAWLTPRVRVKEVVGYGCAELTALGSQSLKCTLIEMYTDDQLKCEGISKGSLKRDIIPGHTV